MSQKGNQYWNGSNGKLWVNDQTWNNVKSFEAKVTANFEEIPDPDGWGTVQVFNGYTIEGTLSLRKTDSRAINLIAEGFSTGVMPDVKIISKAFNKTTGKTERIALKGITFSELTLQKWEERTITEEELPFKAESFEVLQTA